MLKKTFLLSSLVILSACNESDSNDVSTDRLVLDATLSAEADTAKINASLGKEKSSVVIVLNGGDFFQITDNKTTTVMGQESNIVNDTYYRATLPLNTSSTYKIIFNRAAQNQKFESTFPTIPPAFNIVYPTEKQKFSLVATPQLNVEWDTKINSEKLKLSGYYDCAWITNPAVYNTQSQTTTTELNKGRTIDITIDDKQKNARIIPLVMKETLQFITDNLKSEYPNTSFTFNNCVIDLKLVAQNFSSAHSEFSSKSSLSSIRESNSIQVILTP